MNTTKILSTAGIGAAIVTGSLLAVSYASAQTSEGEDRQAQFASNLATELDLDSSEVQAALESLKEQRQAEREEARAERLAGLVEDGTLTQEQADQLTAFKDDFRAEIEALKESGAEREEIQAAKEANKAEIQDWADEQGLNLDDIRQEKDGRKGKFGKYNIERSEDGTSASITRSQ